MARNPFFKITQLLSTGMTPIFLAALLVTMILGNMDFNLLEANLYDLRMSRGYQEKADSQIVLVTIDDPTTHALDEFAPLPLDLHALFMEEMEKLEPRGVGYLVDFNRVEQANPDLPKRKEWADRFVDAANRLQSKGAAIVLGTPFDVAGEVLPPFPLSSLNHSIAVIHKDSNVFAEDKITRRALVALNGKHSFHIEMARRLNLIHSEAEPRGTFFVPEADAKYFFFQYHGSTVRKKDALENGGGDPMISVRDTLSYPRVSFSDIVRGTVAKEAIQGKIVLVSTMTKEEPGDYAFTPFSKSSYTNPKITIHANILDSVIHNQGIERMPSIFNYFIIFFSISFVLWWVLNSTPLYGVFATLGLAAVIILLGQLLFKTQLLWLKQSSPLIGIFLSYYLGAPYRLIREYKKRWDYQRKNEILVQVEELKTNFLSLVTHDLKTPVARIQGLTETVLRQASQRLVFEDKETLKHIINSTEELNRFISSILELSKIESNRIQINRESKDVNQIIERLIDGFRPTARNKNIQLNVDLEPLFPIRIDHNLIMKVLSNLVDNALKYSPENSQIWVQSREEGPWVVISIRDEGIGMSEEERLNLFTKFYRAKNDATTKIAGTGLGLYLTKFFIEAHRGRVEVQSESGKGSLFKVYLPLEEAEPVKTAGLTRVIEKIGFKRKIDRLGGQNNE